MLGFIKKDLLTIKSNYKILIVYLIFVLVFTFQNNAFITFLPPYLSAMLLMSTFGYDEKNHWDAYAATFPKGRINVVRAKYLATILITFIVSLLVFIIALGVSYLGDDKFDMLETIVTLLATFGVTIIFISCMYPVFFKYGAEKSRLVILVVIVAMVGLFYGIIKLASLKALASVVTFIGKHIILFMILTIILITYISYIISKKVYLKREL